MRSKVKKYFCFKKPSYTGTFAEKSVWHIQSRTAWNIINVGCVFVQMGLTALQWRMAGAPGT